jgi:peptidoglycan/xylan/chitin deacetylase (PgdA/CDA1 family)
MLNAFARRLTRPNRFAPAAEAVILMYHRIDTVERDPWRLAVQPKHFAEQLEVISGLFQPISMQQLRESLTARRVPPRSIVVTFDDGYRDNLFAAKPLLEEHAVPATIYVTTGYLDSPRDFWWDELEDICARRGIDSRNEWSRLQHLTRTQREAALDDLWLSVGVDAPPVASRTMTSSQVAELAALDILEIGAHTVSHPLLSRIPSLDQLDEIRTSKATLERLLDRTVSSFSYPHGDFSPTTVRLVQDENITTACTTSGDPVTQRTHPLELPRLHVLDWTGDELEQQLERRFSSSTASARPRA